MRAGPKDGGARAGVKPKIARGTFPTDQRPSQAGPTGHRPGPQPPAGSVARHTNEGADRNAADPLVRGESERNQKQSSSNSMMSSVVASATARSADSSGSRFCANQRAVATLPV